MKFNQALGSGNVLVGERVKIELEISAVKQAWWPSEPTPLLDEREGRARLTASDCVML